MADKTIEAGILLSGEKEFKTAVTSVNKSLTSMKSELSLVSAECEGQANTLESLSKKNEVLNRIWEEQKRKVSATKSGLDNAKESYENVGKGLEKLWVDLEKATDKMQDMENIYGSASEEAQKQQMVILDLSAAIEKGEYNYVRAGDRVKDWETKLNYAEGQVIKANKALNQNTAYMKEAENATDHCATSIDAFGKETKKTEKVVTDYGEKIKSALVNTAVSKGTEMLTTMGSAAASAAVAMEQAGNQIQASTGLTGEALEQYKDVLEDVYANNYGDSLDDVSQSIANITHNMGELDNATLQRVTESAITLRDTFDMDLDETLRGAKSLMYQFGLTADQAFDLLGSGAQAGLDYTHELGDNVSEYAGNFAQAGYSAEEYFQLLKNGTSNGAYNLDKVNDAINEVTNKLADGAIEGALAIYSTDTQNLFKQWQNGGATQKQVIDSIVADINNCTNQQDALTMSATAFGTMGEDSNLKFVQSLTSVGDGFTDVQGKMDEIKDIKYDDLNSQITEIGRTIQMKLGDVLQKMLPAVNSGLELVADNLDLVMSASIGLGTAIGLNKMFKSGFFQTAVKGLTSLVKVTSLAEVKTLALNAAVALGPWGLAAIALGGVAAAATALALSEDVAVSESRKMVEETEKLADKAKELKQNIKETQQACDDNVSSTQTQYVAYQNMSDRLYELNDQLKTESLTTGEANVKKAEMGALVESLNGSMPGLNLEIDEQNGLIKQGKEYTDQYIESLQHKAVVAVLEEQLTELYKAQAEAQITAAEASVQQSDATEQLLAAQERQARIQEAQKEFTPSTTGQELENLAEKYNVTTKEITDGYVAMEKLTNTTDDYNNTIQNSSKAIDESNEAEAEAQKAIDEKTKTLTEFCKTLDLSDEEIDQLIRGLAGEGEAAENTSDSIDDLTESTKKVDDANQAAKATAKAQEEALESLRAKYEETKSSIQQSMEQKINLFEAFNGGDKTSLDDMLDNLDSQLEGLSNWKSNMETLAGEVGEIIGPELYSKLVELGPSAANAVQEMVNALDPEKGGNPEKLKQLSEKYAQALDFSDGAAEKLAKVQAVIDTALRKMNSSSDVDFSNLRSSIDSAVNNAAEGWDNLPAKTRTALDQAVEAARQSGAKIPDGLADGIKSGEISPADAIAQLNGSVQAQFQFLSEMADEAGIKIPQDIRDGIATGGPEAVDALQALAKLFGEASESIEEETGKSGAKAAQNMGEEVKNQSGAVVEAVESMTKEAGEAANKYTSTFQNTGKNLLVSMAKGMSEARGNVTSTTGGTVLSAISTAQGYSFSDTGYNLMSGLASGINAGSNLVYEAVRRVVNQAKNEANKAADSHSPSRVFRNQVGLYIAQGMAEGIKDGQKDVMTQAVELARVALYGAQEELDIHSPSGVFRKAVGEQISAGVAFGIEAKKGVAVNKSKELAKSVYKAAVSWMDEYKKKSATTLEDEKYFWQKLAKTVDKGTQEYKKALNNATKIDDFEKKIQKKVEKAFDVSKTVTKNGKKVKKTTQEYNDDIYSAASKYLNNYKVLHNVSLQEEEYYWKQVKSKLKKGTQAWYEATKQLNSIKTEIKKAAQEAKEEAKKEAANAVQERKQFGLSGGGLDMYKTYYKVSAKAEMDYWDIVRKQFKAGTAERIEADQKYFEAKEDLNEQLKDLEDDYYDKCKDVQDKLTDDIKELTDTYNQAFKDQKSSIKSAFGTFDEFYSEAESPEKLLANMQSQAAGYALWIDQLQELSAKGILNDEFMKELEQMGPEAAATIMSLNMMSEAQLKQANEAWEEKDRLAEAQAAKETEALRVETENKIKELTAAAQQEMNAYKTEYEKASAELTAAIEKPLRDLANKATTLGEAATAQLIQGLGNQAKSKETTNGLGKVTDQVAKGLNGLPKAGKSIGKDMLDGILKGLSNSLEIKKGAKSIVKEIEDAIKKEAGIKSPSTRFRDIVGKQLSAGIAVGIEQGSGKAVNASADMIDKMLEGSKKKVAEQQKALESSMQSINGGAGIAAINDLVNTPIIPSTTVNINNTEVAGLVSQMGVFMQEMRQEMRNLKVVLDTGTLVGEISPDVGNNLAAITRRLR